MHHHFRILAAFAMLCTLFSCGDDQQSIDIIEDIGNDLEFSLWEKLGPGDSRTLEFHVSTIDEYGCKNAIIPYQLVQTFYNIDVNFLGVTTPDGCEPGLAPARAEVAVAPLSAQEYRFSVRLRDVINNAGMLLIDPDKYELKLDDTKGLLFPYRILMRIPPNCLWGYVSQVASSPAQSFLTDLSGYTKPLLLSEGNYGYFQVDPSGKLTMTFSDQDASHQTFFYGYDDQTSDQIKALLSDYRQANPDLAFHIFTSKGETW